MLVPLGQHQLASSWHCWISLSSWWLSSWSSWPSWKPCWEPWLVWAEKKAPIGGRAGKLGAFQWLPNSKSPWPHANYMKHMVCVLVFMGVQMVHDMFIYIYIYVKSDHAWPCICWFHEKNKLFFTIVLKCNMGCHKGFMGSHEAFAYWLWAMAFARLSWHCSPAAFLDTTYGHG